MTDTTRQRVAFRSTQGNGAFAKKRWTELAVYFTHTPAFADEFRWIAEIVGRSSMKGEVDKVQRLAADKLDRVLAFFDESAPASAVREQARAWAVDNADFIASGNMPVFTGTTDEDALDWLYGKGQRGTRGFNTRVAADFGIGESSVRMALSGNTGIKVPLLAVVGMLDRKLLPSILAAAREDANG